MFPPPGGWIWDIFRSFRSDVRETILLYPLTLAHQVGIQFVQIGNAKKATAFLRELDDALSCKYSIRVRDVLKHL